MKKQSGVIGGLTDGFRDVERRFTETVERCVHCNARRDIAGRLSCSGCSRKAADADAAKRAARLAAKGR